MARVTFSSYLALGLLGYTYAAVGPVTDLKIVSKVVSPDGFGRVYAPPQISSSIHSYTFIALPLPRHRRPALVGLTLAH